MNRMIIRFASVCCDAAIEVVGGEQHCTACHQAAEGRTREVPREEIRTSITTRVLDAVRQRRNYIARVTGALTTAELKLMVAGGALTNEPLTHSADDPVWIDEALEAIVDAKVALAEWLESVRAAEKRICALKSLTAKPCPGFQWIGQLLNHCDRCGLPYWEHTHEAKFDESAGSFLNPAEKLVPITAEQAAAVKKKWDR
ncbi:MAG TPA: hypothetical protein VFQ44_02315 [Streptosporangiaceae bacterium]|nr:hypothetical protein [Streptosporangiaceae bacterium]